MEAVTYCPTSFGRQNKMGSPAEGLRWQRDHFVEMKKFLGLPEEERAGKEPIGLFHPARGVTRPH